MNKQDEAKTAGKSYLCTTCFRIYATCNKFKGVPNILSDGFDTKGFPDMGPRCRGKSDGLFEINFDTCLSQTRAPRAGSYIQFREGTWGVV